MQPGGVPLIVGGHTKAAAVRAGRYGDGYLPLGYHNASDGFEFMDAMREAAEQAGRDPDAIELSAGGAADPTTSNSSPRQASTTSSSRPTSRRSRR